MSLTSNIAQVLRGRSSAQTNLSADSSRWWVQCQRNDQRINGQTGRQSEHLSGLSQDELESVPFRGGVPSQVSVFMVKDPDPARQKRLYSPSAPMKKPKVAPRSNVAMVTMVPPSSPKAQTFRRYSRERVPPDKSTWTPSSSPTEKIRRLQCPF